MGLRVRPTRVLRRLGYELAGSGGVRHLRPGRLRKLELPVPVDPADDGAPLFWVDVDKVTTRVGFSYLPGGWHPYLASLTERVADPDLPYDETTLHRFFQTYRPHTVQDVLLEDVREPQPPLSAWPPAHPLYDVWSLNHRIVAETLRGLAAREPVTSQYFGPRPPELGKPHLDRVVAVYESMRDRGYVPSVEPAERLTGYFLLRDDDYRFVIGHGNHRMPALKLLGVPRIQATLRRGHPAVVDERDLQWWSTERGGLFGVRLVERVFRKMFEETGRAKAEHLGLLRAGG